MAACVRHPFDDAADVCGGCAQEFCATCLVYVHGPQRPPLCVPCALVAAGVRRQSAAERRLHRARQRELARQRAEVRPRPAAVPAVDDDPGGFGPMSERGRAYLAAARNGHADAHPDAPPAMAADATGSAERRRRFLGLF